MTIKDDGFPKCTHHWFYNKKERWCMRCGAQELTKENYEVTDSQIDNAVKKAADNLLDYIYEYGTAAEGTQYKIRALARAAIKAANEL